MIKILTRESKLSKLKGGMRWGSRGHEAHLHHNQKKYMYKNSHRKLGIGRKTPIQPRPQERFHLTGCMLSRYVMSNSSWSYSSSGRILKEISPKFHWKHWCWSWNSNTLATWWEELTHWKRPWCWERLKAKGEEISRGWNGSMVSPIPWICTWADFRTQWGTGRPVCYSPRWCKESGKT